MESGAIESKDIVGMYIKTDGSEGLHGSRLMHLLQQARALRASPVGIHTGVSDG
jgi:hypothetical protein